MMSDNIRLDSFRRAIFDTVAEGDVVVDLGSGVGILAFFAAQAGAEKVYAIEELDVALAQKLAQKNGLDNITFIRGNSAEIKLPEKADVLVSETLGSFAIDENTLILPYLCWIILRRIYTMENMVAFSRGTAHLGAFTWNQTFLAITNHPYKTVLWFIL